MTVQHSLRRYLLLGFAAMLMLAGRTLALGRDGPKSRGAVIAPGKLVVDSNVKKVQHPTGGVVGDLRVKDGDRVKTGRHRGAARRDAGRAPTSPSSPRRSTSWRRARPGSRPSATAPTRSPSRPTCSARRNEPEVAPGDGERAAPVRAAPLGARGPEGAAARADRPAPPADRRQRRAGGGQDQGDRLEPAGAGRHPRPCGSRTWCRSTA